jgi:hypothetical protein
MLSQIRTAESNQDTAMTHQSLRKKVFEQHLLRIEFIQRQLMEVMWHFVLIR